MKNDVTRSQRAFSLVEVTLALGVAGFCLIAIFGLLPVGLTSNQTSIEQTAAASLASTLVADLRATAKTTPPTAKSSPYFNISIPASGSATHTIFLKDDGTAAGAADADAVPSNNPRYRATLVFSAPASLTQKNATVVRILITWPALSDTLAATLPTNFVGSFETVTALDRN